VIESDHMPTFEELLDSWDGEQAVIHRDRESGGWIFICMHSTQLGPAAGGTRLKVYDTPADGLQDAMRLSAGMTAKLAVADLGRGGGKAVLAMPKIPDGEERRALLRRYGDIVASLGGGFIRAPMWVRDSPTWIAINFLELNGRSQADVDAALAKIGDTLTEIYARADTEGISTAAAADALAASRLRQP
jgi:hypothetical protein